MGAVGEPGILLRLWVSVFDEVAGKKEREGGRNGEREREREGEKERERE